MVLCMTSTSSLYCGIWLCSQQSMSVCDRIMARTNYGELWSKYNILWNEFSDPIFVNNLTHHLTNILELIMDGIEMLNGPTHLSEDQRNDLIAHVKQLQTKLHKDSTLVNRLDPRVPIYEITPLEHYLNNV